MELIIEQNTPEWHLERCGKLSGSTFSDIMPGKRGGYLKGREDLLNKLLVENLTGIPTESISTPAMDWGNQHEDEAANVFSYNSGFELETCGFYHSKIHPLIGVSTDRLIPGTAKAIEIKCPYNSVNHIKYWRNGMPDIYEAQVQGNIWVRELEGMYFVSYDPRMPEHLQLYFKYYERDNAYIDKLEYESLKFVNQLEEEIEKWAV